MANIKGRPSVVLISATTDPVKYEKRFTGAEIIPGTFLKPDGDGVAVNTGNALFPLLVDADFVTQQGMKAKWVTNDVVPYFYPVRGMTVQAQLAASQTIAAGDGLVIGAGGKLTAGTTGLFGFATEAVTSDATTPATIIVEVV